MIISASRRTDIPAFYADWFMNRVRAGFCMVRNPRNPKQTTWVSLGPADVDAVVFWSKNPEPMLRHLHELDTMRFHYYFLFTINDYPVSLEPHVPPLAGRLATFRDLAGRIGKGRVVWRYDPVILSACLDAASHRRAFDKIARSLEGYTQRVTISIVDLYSGTRRRLAAVERLTGDRFVRDPFSLPRLEDLVRGLSSIAADRGMDIQSCAEDDRLSRFGINPGKCVDDGLVSSECGITVSSAKDRGQREKCGCVRSRDIGANDSCVHGCEYCYATSSMERAVATYNAHDPEAEFLAG
ncbi:MAG: DUF1848 domain-containing protein [bacterium]